MKEKPRHSLKISAFRSIAILALMLAISTGAAVGVQSYVNRMKAYTSNAFSFAKIVSRAIDGNRIRTYLESGEEDEYYRNIHVFIRATLKEALLMEHLYVIVPYDDRIVYVWDGDMDLHRSGLGDSYAYESDKDKEDVMAAMSQSPPEKLSVQHGEYGFTATAYYPIYDKTYQPVAVVGVDFSMESIRQTIINYLMLIVATIITITLLLQLIFYRFVDADLIRPIELLTKSTSEMVSNLERQEEISLNIKTGDEIEELADSIIKMDSDLRAYIKKLAAATAEREKIGAELRVARTIQADSLPSKFPAFPDRDEFDLYATMDPAKEVGGDFYDFFMVDDDHIALVMADVSGKGIAASLFMMVSKIFIKEAVQSGLSPSEALARVNDQLLENNKSGMFVTVWLAIIELSSGKGTAANAGHEHPALKRKGGRYELIRYHHSPAAATIEGIPFRQHDFEIGPGDTIFVYTDGVTEATNSSDELFGDERLERSLNSHADAAPAELLPAVKADIDKFVGDAPQFDDITMLAFAYFGSKNKTRGKQNNND